MQLIDTHAHLDDERFSADLRGVIERAELQSIVGIVAVGTTFQTSRQAVQIARQYPFVRASVGIHPNYVALTTPDDWAQIVQLADEPEVVAVGETGLDRFRHESPFEMQLENFERHLTLSRSRQLPVVIHCRDAEADLLPCLERAAIPGPLLGVMHSFTGPAALAARCLELGLYISFAGQLTYTNRKFEVLREVARCVPLDRLLVETDSPYLAPEPHRGQRNEPAYVRQTAEKLAAIREMALTDLCNAVTENARRLFRGLATESTTRSDKGK